ncbi:Golgi integral membrane protein 4, partial [Asbolus verrucosus]
MTTSRIVRGTKARIFLYICAILIITGIIACYNNTLSQLEDARKSSEICHQQEENLSTQLQVISDYKQRLEKSLKTEKAEHQQAKNDLENKLNEEKSKNEKAANDANLRFSSLQQHFNLLQTQHDDFKEECSKTQSKQMNEINDLQAKLKEVQEELKKVESSKENLKSQYLQLQVDKESLQKQLNTNVYNNDDSKSKINHLTKVNHELQRELDEVKAKCTTFESIQPPNVVQDSSSPRNSQNLNHQDQVDANEIKAEDKAKHEVLIDPQQQVIQSPPNQNFIKIPTKSTTSSSLKVSQGSLNGARPLLMPTVTPKSANSVPPSPYVKKLPEGVVPPPEKRDVDKKAEDEKNELPEETINNRYRNKISDNAFKEEAKKVDEVDKENVAHEVFDQPHIGAYDNVGFGDVIDPIKNAEKQNYDKQHIDNLGIGDKEGNKVDENYYKDNQNDMLGEENDPEDDDPEEYGEPLGRVKDPV